MYTAVFLILLYLKEGLSYKCYVCPTPNDLEDYFNMDERLKSKNLKGWSPDISETEKDTLITVKAAFIACRKLEKFDSCETDYGCFLIVGQRPNPQMGVGSFIAMGCVNPNTGGTDLLRDPRCEGSSINFANDMIYCQRCTTDYCNYHTNLKNSVERLLDLNPRDPLTDPASAPKIRRPLKQWERAHFAAESVRNAPRFEGLETVATSQEAQINPAYFVNDEKVRVPDWVPYIHGYGIGPNRASTPLSTIFTKILIPSLFVCFVY